MWRARVGGMFACVLVLAGVHACGDTDDDTRKAPDASSGGSAGAVTDAPVETKAEANTGGSAGTPADSGCDVPNVSEAVACQSYANVICSLYEECTPIYFDELGFGGKPVCVERLELLCHSQLAGPGVLMQPGTIQLFTDALSSITCTDLAMGWYAYALSTAFIEPECAYWGTLPAGAPCHATAQCMDGFQCDVPFNDVCGSCVGTTLGSDCKTVADCDVELFCGPDDHCQARKALGESCIENNLPPNFIGGEECVADAYCHESVCVPRVGEGGPCTKNGACTTDLVCGANGLCKPPALGEVGASCSPDEWLSCNIWKGVRCEQLVCQPRPLPAPGETCAMSGSDAGGSGELYCAGGATCVWSSAVNPGVCMLPAADGESCDIFTGPPCRYPAECVLGICTVADETTCTSD